MQANSEKGTLLTNTFRQQVIVNFCHTVLRHDDDLLRQAIDRYQQSLIDPNRR